MLLRGWGGGVGLKVVQWRRLLTPSLYNLVCTVDTSHFCGRYMHEAREFRKTKADLMVKIAEWLPNMIDSIPASAAEFLCDTHPGTLTKLFRDGVVGMLLWVKIYLRDRSQEKCGASGTLPGTRSTAREGPQENTRCWNPKEKSHSRPWENQCRHGPIWWQHANAGSLAGLLEGKKLPTGQRSERTRSGSSRRPRVARINL